MGEPIKGIRISMRSEIYSIFLLPRVHMKGGPLYAKRWPMATEN